MSKREYEVDESDGIPMIVTEGLTVCCANECDFEDHPAIVRKLFKVLCEALNKDALRNPKMHGYKV